ncbi:plant intracellular Ras-group-related LRR protein 5-like isoform X1 [Cucurbita maxima]|uniref:Plant intracellular Ras-group-related LRR protein 5-like isoform X1 n=1 Tax=Cucurbita maxima TaxID=3661 RepID=A0A6J1K648_CUCMA|nr:plant intracellular Ras-group-related LRR protein 5-like isoform X1 [Cucurbita maxima]
MDATFKQDPLSSSFIDTVNELTRIFRSLPARPSIEEVEAAVVILNTVQNEEDFKLGEISKQEVPENVPEELFSILQQMRKTMVLYESHEQRREAIHLIELDNILRTFDELIQRSSLLVSGDSQAHCPLNLSDSVDKVAKEALISHQNLENKTENGELESNGNKGFVNSFSSGLNRKYFDESWLGTDQDFVNPGLVSRIRMNVKLICDLDGKLSSMKVAALIESIAKSGSTVLNLRGKLMDKMELLPLSIGKLSDLVELDLSENKIMALPPGISDLRSLQNFDIHSNQLINLPETFGELVNLTYVDLHGNRLKSLPASFGNLKNLITLDLSSNLFTHLPDIIGNLSSLKKLNAETNELEELPYTIGSCLSLVELRLDFNAIKALPEAIGKLECLEILTLHYNRIRGLPTTMGNLPKLKELDVSFNELETIPENLCFAVSLRKLNVGKNFADLRALPRSIGNLEMLEELDMSANQIRFLPDSFRFLSKLRVLRTDDTPLEEPPREVLELGAQGVVKYMADAVEKRGINSQPAQERGFWIWFFSICCSKTTNDTPNHKLSTEIQL